MVSAAPGSQTWAAATRRVVVWMFGGSAAFGWQQRDDETIASQVARLAHADGVDLEIHNFSVPADVAFQQHRRLERELSLQEHHPDLVLHYDGFNDLLAQSTATGKEPRRERAFRSLLDNGLLPMVNHMHEQDGTDTRHYTLDETVAWVPARGYVKGVADAEHQYSTAIGWTRRMLLDEHIRFVDYFQPSEPLRARQVKGEPDVSQDSIDGMRELRAHLPAGTVDISSAVDHVRHQPTKGGGAGGSPARRAGGGACPVSVGGRPGGALPVHLTWAWPDRLWIRPISTAHLPVVNRARSLHAARNFIEGRRHPLASASWRSMHRIRSDPFGQLHQCPMLGAGQARLRTGMPPILDPMDTDPMDQGGPTFSVIIPTYNRPDLLQEAVGSVIAQTVQDWECLIVDDAGTMPIGPFEDPRVRIIRREKNGGAAAALNTGAHAAAGRYLVMLADDDLFTPQRMEIALEGLQRAPIALCLGDFIGANRKKGKPEKLPEGDLRDTILDTFVPHMSTVAIERTLWTDLREDYRTVEDVEWWLRTARTARVAAVPRLGHLTRPHPGVRHMSGVDARYRDCQRLLEDYADWFATHPRAKAFRLRRVAYFAIRTGHKRQAVRSLAKAMRLHPDLRTAKQMGLALIGR